MRPLLLAATRFLIAGIIMYAWVRVRSGVRGPNAREWRAGFITGGIFFVLGNGAVVWSQQRVPSGIAALLVAIVPLWVVLLDWARPPHNRPRPVVLLGVVVGLLGLVLLVGLDVLRGGGHVDPLAALVLAAGSFSWACGTLYSPRAGLHRSGAMATATQLLGGGTLLLIAGTLFREHTRIDWGNISALTIVSLAYLVTFGSLVGFTAYAWLVNVTSPARLATYAYVNPIVAIFLGWLFAGERLNARTLVASGVVLAGVVLITIGAGRSG